MRYGSSGNLTATQPDKTGIETIEKLKAFAQPESMALRRSSGSSGRKVRAMAQFCRISSRLAQ